MTHVAHHLTDMATVSMIVAVAAEATAEMILTATEDLVAMIVVTEAMADVIAMTDMVPVESIVMLAVMTATAAVEEMSDAEVVEVTLIATSVVIATVDAHPEMLLQLPPMVTQHLVERVGSHTEVETMMIDSPVVVIDR
jgi:hypothetical protein